MVSIAHYQVSFHANNFFKVIIDSFQCRDWLLFSLVWCELTSIKFKEKQPNSDRVVLHLRVATCRSAGSLVNSPLLVATDTVYKPPGLSPVNDAT